MEWPPLCLSPGEGGRDLPVSHHNETTGVWLAWRKKSPAKVCLPHLKPPAWVSSREKNLGTLGLLRQGHRTIKSLGKLPGDRHENIFCRHESHTLGKNWTCLLHWECPSVNMGFFKGRLKIKTHNRQKTVLTLPLGLFPVTLCVFSFYSMLPSPCHINSHSDI